MIAATVTMTFTQIGSGTDVEVISTVELTGQGAAFGETVVKEASDRLVQRLVDCVSGKFADGLGDLPSAEELATSTPAEQAAPRAASEGETSGIVEPQEADRPDRVPAAEVPAEPDDLDTTEATAEPTDLDTTETTAEPTDLDADKLTAEPADTDADKVTASPRNTDDATAARQPSQASAPHPSASLSTTTGPQGGAMATVVLPRVRRFGPPVLGALVVGSLISGIVRRLRR
jgi:hypothetical protein